MSFIENFRRLFSRKESQARIALSINKVGEPISSTANYASFASQGYNKNATVFRCIHLIATAASGIKWEVYKKRPGADGKKIQLTEHPLLTLMDRPNPMMGRSQFFEAIVAYLTIAGNSYIESAGPTINGAPTELWPMRPDLIKIVPSKLGYPQQYVFTANGVAKTFDCDFFRGIQPVLHLKTFNPLDIWYGLSPMESALLNIDQMNAANKWNLALMQNSASPSGVLAVESTDANPTGSLSDETFRRLKEEFASSYQGARNAGKPMLLEGGLKWQAISLSPKELEWLQGKEVTVKDICNVFGVPVMMLGFGDTTYANYGEARLAFYEDTIIPLLSFLETELNNWLVPKFGNDIVLEYDRDDIGPLNEKRESKYSSLQAVNFLTQNEKRLAAGYQESDGWDVFVIGSNILAHPQDMDNSDPTQDNPDYLTEGNQDGEGNEISESETEDDSEDQTSSETTEEEIDGKLKKSYKLFNPVTKKDINNTWRRTNSRRNSIERPFAKMLEEDFKDLARQLQKVAKGKNDANVLEFALMKTIEENIPELKKTLRRYIRFTVNDFGSIVFDKAKSELKVIETKKNERTWQDWATSYVETRTAKAITDIEGTTKKQVRKTVQRLVSESLFSPETEIDVAKELQDVFENLSPGRARTIARTEINAASNSSTTEAVRSLEIPNMQKEWVSNEDARTRDGGKTGEGPNHAIMNGLALPLDEKFTVPPDADMDGPGDPSAEASQICNCRCTLIYRASKR